VSIWHLITQIMVIIRIIITIIITDIAVATLSGTGGEFVNS
jgi:hypothetical protein